MTAFMTNPSYQTEICIIGGGPGGTFTSLQLSKAKIPHLLVDKKIFPRDKVCGEAYDGRVWHGLRKINPLYVKELLESKEARCSWAHDISANGSSIHHIYSLNSPKMLINRAYFDEYLTDKVKESSYATVLEDCFVKKIAQEGDATFLHTSKGVVKTALVINASGELSHLNAKNTDGGVPHIFARAYFKNVPESVLAAVKGFMLRKPINCICYISPAGKDITSLAVGLPTEKYKGQSLHIFDILEECIKTSEIQEILQGATLVGKPKGTSMTLNNYKNLVFSNGNIINVGSAVFSVHPLTGYGIGNAVEMSQIAVGQVTRFLGQVGFAGKVGEGYAAQAQKALKPIITQDKLANRVITAMLKPNRVCDLAWLLFCKAYQLATSFHSMDTSHRNLAPYLKKCLVTGEEANKENTVSARKEVIS